MILNFKKRILNILFLFVLFISCNDNNTNNLDTEKELPNEGTLRVKLGWNHFQKNGQKISSELIIHNGEPFINQLIIYNQKGDLDSINSKFFKINIDDTLPKGANIVSANLYTFNRPFEARSSSIIIENSYPDGTTKKDTFVGNFKNLEFGIYGTHEGPLKIKGKILEIILYKDETKKYATEIEITSYFEKELFISDKKIKHKLFTSSQG